MSWRQRWRQSRLLRHVGQLAGANALAQALPLLAAPVLTRLYAPEDFAVLAVFASALALLLAVGTLRFEWSVPNARTSAMAATLVMAGLLALVTGAALLSLALEWWPAEIAAQPSDLSAAALPGPPRSLGLSTLPVWAAVLLPLALLGGGLLQLLQAWQVRAAELAPVAWSKGVQGVAAVALPLLLWPWLASPDRVPVQALGLVLGVAGGAWLALLPFGPPFHRGGRALWAGLRRASRRRLAAAGRRFWGEALWSTLVSVLNAAAFAVLPLLLLRHHSLAEVGWWALVHRVALGPVGLITSAVSQGFWAEAAQLIRTDPAALERLYRRNTARLFKLGLALGAVALAGPLYVGPLFGAAQWEQAGWVLAASAPLMVGIVAGSPLSHLVIHGRQPWQAGWDAARIALAVGVVEVCAVFGWGLVNTVALLSTVLGVLYGALVALNLLAFRRRSGGVPPA